MEQGPAVKAREAEGEAQKAKRAQEATLIPKLASARALLIAKPRERDSGKKKKLRSLGSQNTPQDKYSSQHGWTSR